MIANLKLLYFAPWIKSHKKYVLYNYVLGNSKSISESLKTVNINFSNLEI